MLRAGVACAQRAPFEGLQDVWSPVRTETTRHDEFQRAPLIVSCPTSAWKKSSYFPRWRDRSGCCCWASLELRQTMRPTCCAAARCSSMASRRSRNARRSRQCRPFCLAPGMHGSPSFQDDAPHARAGLNIAWFLLCRPSDLHSLMQEALGGVQHVPCRPFLLWCGILPAT